MSFLINDFLTVGGHKDPFHKEFMASLIELLTFCKVQSAIHVVNNAREC